MGGFVEKIEEDVYLVDVAYTEAAQTYASYILVGENTLVIDPGPAHFVNNLIEALEIIGVDKKDVKYIALTHIHIDHGGSAGTLLKELPNAKVLVHPLGEKHLIDPTALWEGTKKVLKEVAEELGRPEPIPQNKIITIKDYQIITVSENKDLCVLAINTPGHASHHVSYFIDRGEIIFAGDSAGLFIGGHLAPTTPPPFRLEPALESLQKMLLLKPKKVAFAHFGVHSDAPKLLLQYYGQLVLWRDCLKKLLEEGWKRDELEEILMKIDSEAKAFQEAVSNNKFMKDALKRSLEGFLDYLNKSKES